MQADLVEVATGYRGLRGNAHSDLAGRQWVVPLVPETWVAQNHDYPAHRSIRAEVCQWLRARSDA